MMSDTPKFNINDYLAEKKALVIDDLTEARANLRRCLESFGMYKVDMASNGTSAMEKFSQNTYDIVLSDYNLGEGKDGQQVLEEGRHMKYVKEDMIYIMITAENTKEMVMGALECQPDSYLTKPYTPDDLKSRVQRVSKIKFDTADINQALDKEDYEAAITACDTILENEESPYKWLCRRKKGIALIGAKKYQEAIDLYSKWLQEQKTAWAILDKGKAEFYLEKYDDAIKSFQGMLDENAAYVEASDWLAMTYEKKDDLITAQETLEKAVEQSSKSCKRQMKLGSIAQKNKNEKVAARAYRNAIKYGKYSCHKTPENYKNYAKSLQNQIKSDPGGKVGRSLADEAIRAMDQMIEDCENSFSLQLDAAIIKAATNINAQKSDAGITQIEEAEKIYQKITNFEASNHLSMANGYHMIDNNEKAKEIFAKIKEDSVPENLKFSYDSLKSIL